MPAIVLEIPAEVAAHLRLPEGRAAQDLRRELAVFLVREGLLSQPQACQVAGMQRLDFEAGLRGDERELRLRGSVGAGRAAAVTAPPGRQTRCQGSATSAACGSPTQGVDPWDHGG